MRILRGIGLILCLAGQLAGKCSAQSNKLPVGHNGARKTYEALLVDLRGVGGQEVKPTDQKATHSLRELYEGQVGWRNSIESIKIDFHASIPVMPTSGASTGPPDIYTFNSTYARKGAKQFRTYEQSSIESKFGSKPDATSTPNFFYAYNGTQMREVNKGSKTASLQTLPTNALSDLANMVFECISYPIGLESEELKQTTWYIPTALDTPGSYKLQATLEKVDGFDCHVVTSGVDTLWIDVPNGFAVRRRVMFRVVGSDVPAVIQALYICQDFTNEAELVWLPETVRRVDFATQEYSVDRQGRITGKNEFKILWEVNNVLDSLFELSFPPGFVVFNHDNGTQFFAPEGEDMLDEAIKNARRMPGVRLASDSAVAPQSRISPLLIANISACLVLLFLVARRRMQRTHARNSA